MCEKNRWHVRIAERLDFLITYRDIRIEQLAMKTEIPEQTIKQWLAGELEDCDLLSVEKLSRVLGTAPEYIIMEAIDEFEKELFDAFNSQKIKK